MKIATILELKRKYEMPSCFRLNLKRTKFPFDKNYTSLLADVKQHVDIF
jgi:hypothetical protein